MLTLVCILLAVIVLGSAWPLSGSLRRRYVSEMYADLAPGLTPPAGAQARRRDVTEAQVRATTFAVQFHPPEGVDPRDVGLLLERQVRPRDLAATIVSLAVQGFLTLRKVDAAADGGPGREDWLVTVTDPSDGREPADSGWLLDHFRGEDGGPVYLSEVKPHLGRAFARLRDEVVETAVRRGYVVADPTGQRAPTGGFVVAAIACLVLAVVLGAAGNPIAWIAAGGAGALALTAGRVRGPAGRTAEGTAAYFRTAGFRRYIATAEANSLGVEEAAGIFSRFLPWAIAFDAVDHWAGVFRDVAAGVDDPQILGLWAPDLLWLAMMPDLALGAGVLLSGIDGALTDLTDSIGDFGGDLFDGGGLSGDGDAADVGDADVGGEGLGDMGGGDGGGFDIGDWFDF